MTVDIILAAYNGAAFIKEQLDSLLAQTYTDINIHVYDDVSTDETREIVADYAASHENVFLHKNKKNLGLTLNFLHGVKRSDADFIMLCDQDDIWKPEKVEKTLDVMRKAVADDEKTPVLVFTDAEIYDGRTPENRSFVKESHYNVKKVDLSALLIENKCIGCSVMINRPLADKLTHIPMGIRYHDWWLALIASAFGKVVYLDEMTLLYRQHGGNQVGGRSFGSYVADRLSGITSQKKALADTYMQGELFYAVYGKELSGKSMEVARAFAMMRSSGFIEKRMSTLRYGFTKSGLIRSAGLFLLM